MTRPGAYAVLSNAQMYAADTAAVKAEVASLDLMENAGRAVARAIMARYPRQPVAVLAGPGNNGGDGFVIARHLSQARWPVTLWLLGPRTKLQGDAGEMAKRWSGTTRALTKKALAEPVLAGAGVVVDALFGAGLTRPLGAIAADLAAIAHKHGRRVIAVDVPSGVAGSTGEIVGPAFTADLTVTFFRKKPAHLLLPARQRCGQVLVCDIGIPPVVLDDIAPDTFENAPALWRARWPRLAVDTHKYRRGALVVMGGPAHQTGAARLAAQAGLRAGAGIVDLASPEDAVAVNAAHLTAVMIKPVAGPLDFLRLAERKHVSALVAGPGLPPGGDTRKFVRAALQAKAPCVLDAGALTAFAGLEAELFDAIGRRQGSVVLTPHGGEFDALFGPDEAGGKDGKDKGGKLARTRKAARRAGAVIVHKGADTVIAAPDGVAIINAGAPATLATAGSGDVLAGMIGGLLAQGMPALDAASAATWLHAQAARAFGPGLIAEDLPNALRGVLRELEAGLDDA